MASLACRPETSTGMKWPPSWSASALPLASSRSATTTSAPASASARQVALPRPPAPPVTRATLSRRSWIMGPESMRAIRLHEFGPPGNLVWEAEPDPEPGLGQVRIAVAAAGVHFIDTAIRAGRRMGPMPPPDLPQIPGREVAGTVDALGAGVDAGWLGRRVVAHLGPASGGYAELAVRDVDAVHALDDHVADAVAVAMIGTGRTAMGILDVAGIGADEVVLVTAAAGGLGALLVQGALAAGATVVGAAG